MLARAALAAVLVPLGLVCWMSMDEIRRCGKLDSSKSRKRYSHTIQ